MQASFANPDARTGGNRPFPSDMKRREFSAAVRLALKDGSIWPAFQPIVELGSRSIAGFEVLARWTDISEGSIPPDRFIGRFEEYNLIDALTERLLNVAACQMQDIGGEGFLAVNIAPRQLLRADLPERILAIAERTGLPPHRIELEITENSLMHDPPRALATLKEIVGLGMKISIDDFGTGYSSLSRLESFPFHKLKIDAQFIRSIEADTSKRRIVAAIIGLGQSLGISVVAEGIETEDQARIVSDLGATFGQGWLFGRPVDASALAALAPDRTDPLRHAPVDRSPFQQVHQLQTLYEQAPVGLCFLDLEGRYVQANDLFAGMHRKRASEILGRTIADVLDDQSLAAVNLALGESMAGKPLDHVYTFHDRNYRVLGSHVRDITGEIIGISLVSVDITEQTQMIAALEERERHDRYLIEFGPNIGWTADSGGRVDYMSPHSDSAPSETMEERIARWYARMHPEDGPRVRNEWLRCLPLGQPFETTFRIRWQNGDFRNVQSRAVPRLDEEGRVQRWYGVISGTLDGGP